MKHATYIGPDFTLEGKTAYVIDDQLHQTGKVEAQFDDIDLRRYGKSLGIGWHEFNGSDFKYDPIPEEDQNGAN